MKALPKTDPVPQSTDLVGWQEAVAKGRLGEFPLEAIVSAFLDLRPNTQYNVRHDLAKYISDDIYRRLLRKVGRNKPNQGKDIIDRVHFHLFEALARPKSADAKGMRVAFGSRVEFRMKDAIASEERANRIPDEDAEEARKKAAKKKRENKTAKKDGNDKEGEEVELIDISEHPDLAEEDYSDDAEIIGGAAIQRNLSLMDGVKHADEKLDVDRFLNENIPDYKRRLAFSLYMEDVPFKSKRWNSIAKAVGIDEKTARQWIEEIQEQLKLKIGEKT